MRAAYGRVCCVQSNTITITIKQGVCSHNYNLYFGLLEKNSGCVLFIKARQTSVLDYRRLELNIVDVFQKIFFEYVGKRQGLNLPSSSINGNTAEVF